MVPLSITAELKLENSAQTTSRFSPVRYRTPRFVLFNIFKGEIIFVGSAVSNRKESKSCLGRVFNFKLGRISTLLSEGLGIHRATSRLESSAQGSSCQLEFVHVVV